LRVEVAPTDDTHEKSHDDHEGDDHTTTHAVRTLRTTSARSALTLVDHVPERQELVLIRECASFVAS
jgi:hypothetical protein